MYTLCFIGQNVLTKLTEDMKAQYIRTRFHSPDGHDIDSVWQNLHPKHFINSLLIHHIKQRDIKDIEAAASSMRVGLMDYNDNISTIKFKNMFRLMKEKFYNRKFETIKISDMFKSFQSEDGSIIEPKFILIDGAPGMGKTTLCKEIAYRWAKGELLKDTNIVFLLFLRDPAVQNMSDLNDFIQYFFKIKKPSDLDLVLIKQCVEILKKRDNSDITILLDGYDELSDKSNDLLIKSIIKGEVLPQCRVVVTSRPIVSLHKLADVRVEVLGFDDESKRDYIKKELKNYPEKTECLLSYLKDHSDINEACYMPIMMTIMVCTFKEYEELPTNQSEIYERFITLVISRYLHEKLPKSILSFDERYQKYLQQLSEFAFKTIESDDIIFSNEDIQMISHNFASSNKELHGLGLLKATEQFSLKKMDTCVWYNFLHLSIHEFLAAYYLKSLETSEQFKILKQTFFIKRYINVWVIFVGLKKDVVYQFHQCNHTCGSSDAAKDQMKLVLQKFHLLDFIENRNINIMNIRGTLLCCKNNEDDLQTDMMQENFIKTIDSWLLFPFSSNWTKLFVSLSSVANGDQLIEIHLLDKNSKDISYHQAVTDLEQNQNLAVLLVSSDTLIGYRCNYHQLANVPNVHGSLENVILRNCLINDNIANSLSSYLSNSHNLKFFGIINCIVKSDQLPLLVILEALMRKSTIRNLGVVLERNNMSTQLANSVANVIKNNSNLQELVLANNNLGPSATVILRALKEHTQLEVLDLDGNNMTGQVAEDLANVIKNNSNLEQLGLENNNMGPSTTMILQALKENSTLKVLNLNGNNIIGQVAEDLANVIKSNSKLEQLGLENSNLGPSATVILQALKENSQLKVLNLNSNNITGQGAEDLANVIKNNSGLEELHLSNNDFRSAATVILQALKENSQLKVLNLNNMTGQVAEDLANVIKNNSGLEELHLSNNDFRSAATVILQALKGNCQLKMLNLNSNNMTREVAEDLANVIKNNSGLEELHLSNNDFRSAATVILQALKGNCQLKMLNLNSNNMTGKVAEDLANVIKSNCNLEKLGLGNNNLGPSAIVILKALKKNSQLKVLNLNGNNMTGQIAEDLANVIKNNSNLEQLGLEYSNLGLSTTVILKALKKNSQLKVFNLNGNNMTGQVAEDLANVVKNNSGLEELYLSNNNLRSSATVILQALIDNSQLKVLKLNSNNMTGQVAEDLANVIKNNSGLEELYLSNNNLGPSATVILQALKEKCKIKILYLHNNKITRQVAEDLAQFIKNNSNLQKLGLEKNNLGPSATVILQALKKHSQLKVLNLNSNNMTGQIAEDLANIIKNNSNLKQLGLEYSNLGPSATVILKALKKNSKLKVLNLDGNSMTEQVAEDLANVIKNNSGLEELYLCNNNLRSSATVILRALIENSQLKVLKLNSNNMTSQFTEDLANVIKNNPGLEELYLSSNNLGPSATVILQALKENPKLKVLNLNKNNMTGQVVEDLANVIKNNSDLEELHLSSNNLGPSATVILQALKENSQLKVLNLNSNNMTGQVAGDLANVIKNNSDLEILYVSNNDFRSSATVILRALKEKCKIKILISNNNKITRQGAEDLAHFIKNNSNLQKLGLENNNLGPSATVILQALKENCKLNILKMSNNFLTEITSSQFVSIIKSNPLINEIWLGDNMLQNGLIDIAMSCNNLTNLRALGLSHNSISPTKVLHLASVVSNIKSLQVLIFGGLILNIKERFHLGVFQIYNTSKQTLMLHIQNNSFIVHKMLEIVCLEMWRSRFVHRIKLNHGIKNFFPTVLMNYFVYMEPNLKTTLSMVKQLKQQLSELDVVSVIITLNSCIKKLKVLDLEYGNINKEAAVKLATALNCNNVMEQLWLRGNILGADGAAVILTSLQNISTLKILDLSYNNISSTSANGIAAVINSNQFLEQLWLDGNTLMTAGVVTIASVLKKHSNLRLLSLSNNGITEDAAEEIPAIVNSNTYLGGLLLCNNQLKSIGRCESLGAMQLLHILELTNNCIDVTAADELALMLSNCLCLSELYLGNNNLETTGAAKVCQALKNIQILQVLSLNNNNITTEAASEICNVINTNTNLSILLLGGNDLQTTGVLQIADTVKNNNQTMQLLSLSDNNVNEQVKKDIIVMLCDLKLFV